MNGEEGALCPLFRLRLPDSHKPRVGAVIVQGCSARCVIQSIDP